MRGNVWLQVNRRWWVVAGLGFIPVVAFAACTPRDETATRAASDCTAPDTSTASVRDRLLFEARRNYTYGSPRAPDTVPMLRNEPGGTLPSMTIASAVRTCSSGRPATNRFLGRIVSGGEYAAMGLAPDTNYIWTDSVSGVPSDSAPSRVLLVPVNATYPMAWLRVDSVKTRMVAAGSDPEPRLLRSPNGYQACSDGCPSGHCENTVRRRSYNPASDDSTVVVETGQ